MHYSLVFETAFTALALFIFSYRMFGRKLAPTIISEQLEPVSIIIPCRNEEANLPRLLSSVRALDYPEFEIIVVDDGSTDRTFAVAESFAGVRVVRAPEKPEGWAGKSWACHVGAKLAKYELLLFTDADTQHLPSSLQMTASLAKNADLVSAVPFHLCEHWWEKGMLLFNVFPLIATAFRQKQQYAIGQYLLFRKGPYLSLGGHERVKGALAEDFDLASAIKKQGGRLALETSGKVFRVQMYSSFAEFVHGWKRLIRTGGNRSSFRSFGELALVFQLFCFCLLDPQAPTVSMFIGALVLLFALRKKFGNFTILSVILAPANVLLFVSISLLVLVDILMQRQINWRGRSYKDSQS